MERVLEMALNVAHGMEYLHKEGIAHRDLKSENLVMDGHGTVKIVVFGVSCFETKCGSNSYDHDGGTYRWMAPEMLRHLPHSRKVDVYSFGIVLWELLTTRLPYEDVNPIQAAFCVVNQVLYALSYMPYGITHDMYICIDIALLLDIYNGLKWGLNGLNGLRSQFEIWPD